MRNEGYAYDGILSFEGGGKSILYHVIEISTFYGTLCKGLSAIRGQGHNGKGDRCVFENT